MARYLLGRSGFRPLFVTTVAKARRAELRALKSEGLTNSALTMRSLGVVRLGRGPLTTTATRSWIKFCGDAIRVDRRLVLLRQRATTEGVTSEMNWRKVFHFVIGIACLSLAVWSAKLMAYNWWAAGGPPVPNAEAYAARGNAFALAAFALVALGVLILVRFFSRSHDS